jgi:methionine synthase II (cobalamin-independent)
VPAIAAMACGDVSSIETSRSRMELLEAFVDFHYPSQFDPGFTTSIPPLAQCGGHGGVVGAGRRPPEA